MNQPEPPLIEGGQGRSGEDLEAEAGALMPFGVAVIVLIFVLLLVAGVVG